ncbi:type II toxin-antitoxin system VapC family toxin [Candidatus Gottesmanbacteria bacterium]|nr:type II toxin-antitoxin system VapC family toxin [Candidatus Gottesmanbacteria bacterium]
MEKVVIDASVAVKWFIEEENSSVAQNLLQKHREQKIKILAPDILVLEVLNGLYYSAHFRREDLHIIARRLFSFEIEYISLYEKLTSDAIKIVANYGITPYDSLFIALAEKENCPLITADTKHHAKKYSKKIKHLDEI